MWQMIFAWPLFSCIIDHLITRSVQIDDCDTLEHLCIIFAQAKKDICLAWTMLNTEIGLHTTHTQHKLFDKLQAT